MFRRHDGDSSSRIGPPIPPRERVGWIVWPAVIALLLGIPLVVTLAALVPNIVETNIAPRLAEWRADPIVMYANRSADGTTVLRARFDFAQPERIPPHDELRVAFELYGARPELISAEVLLDGTDCVYRAADGAALTAQRYLAFRRTPTCGHVLHGNSSGKITVHLVVRGSGPIGVMTSRVPIASLAPEWITFPAGSLRQTGFESVVWARFADVYIGGARRRSELLNYAWQLSDSSRWLWAVVFLALIAFCAGGALLAPRQTRASAPGWGRTVAPAVGVGLVGFGLALLYVVLVPPLQAPDEPDYFLSFAQLAHRPDLATQAESLAKVGHLDRMMFHDDERFQPFDVGRPYSRPWPASVDPPGPGKNSVTVELWWTGLAGLVASFGAAGSLLALRIANALFLAVCLGAAAAMLLFVSNDEIASPAVASLALLLIPTLPFFATYVSEFSLLISVYVFAAVVAIGLFFDTRRAHLLGFPLGLAASLALGSGRNALPYLAVIGALGMGRVILGSRDGEAGRDDLRRSLWFWGGLAVGMTVYPCMVTPEFRDGLWTPDARAVSSRFRDLAESLRRSPWLPMVVVPIGFGVERITAALRRVIGVPGTRVLKTARLLGRAAAGAIVMSLIGSLFVLYPVLWNAEVIRAESPWIYVAKVMHVAITGFRLTNHDYWLSTSFWAGFGWLDAVPGTAFVSVLVAFAAAGAVVTSLRITEDGRIRRAIWLAILAFGWAVALVAYAVSTYYFHRNLHGRYLVGLYIATLGLCWSAAAWLPRREMPERLRALAIPRERVILILIAGVHAYALRFILLRYY